MAPIFYFKFMSLFNQFTKFCFRDNFDTEFFGFSNFRSTWLSAGD